MYCTVTVSCPPKKDNSPKESLEKYALGRDIFFDLNSNDPIGKVVVVNEQQNQLINVDISVDTTSDAGNNFYEETLVNKSMDKLHL